VCLRICCCAYFRRVLQSGCVNCDRCKLLRRQPPGRLLSISGASSHRCIPSPYHRATPARYTCTHMRPCTSASVLRYRRTRPPHDLMCQAHVHPSRALAPLRTHPVLQYVSLITPPHVLPADLWRMPDDRRDVCGRHFPRHTLSRVRQCL
jgi:hypothetical protein